MAPNPRIRAAFAAMKALGISEDKTKPVLKKLFKLYDKNWELIEEENYRALVDAIFEEEDNAGAEPAKKRTCNMEEDDLDEETPGQELQRPLKRLRKNQETQASAPPPTNGTSGHGGSLLVQPTVESGSRAPSTPQSSMKGKQIVSPKALVIRDNADPSWLRSPSMMSDPKDKGKSPVFSSEAKTSKQKGCDTHSLMQLKDEPYGDDIPPLDAPLSMILPDLPTQGGSVAGKEKDGDGNDLVAFPQVDERNGCVMVASSREKKINHEPKNTQDDSRTSIDIASSAHGEVKITLSCNSAFGSSDYHIPSLDAVLKSMEDKCLRTYKILDPSFSVMNLMKDMCECFLELGTDSHDESGEQSVNMEPRLNVLKKPFVQDFQNLKGNNPEFPIPSSVSPRKGDTQSLMEVIAPGNVQNNHVEASRETTIIKGNNMNHPDDTSRNLKLFSQDHLSPDNLRSLSHVKDISKGEERIRISWTNEVNNQCPRPFHYVPQSIVYEGAAVHITLSGIKDEDCCSSCLGNCLSSPTPCGCSCINGGEFVYNVRGLLKEWFLETCISMKRDPEKRRYFNCHECPLERSKQSDVLERCKGHLKRNFIKECWKKCGCNKHCGNRVIQQGISCRLQVFMTPEGKGWGLRTLDDIPKGTFVCEYVGEILTMKELYERKKKTNEHEHSYEVFLDAYWATITQDGEALCLDAMYYGNVARFINHRCFDANLIEIPVKVETPKHHYYHLAFFTTRKVQALEELTWPHMIENLFEALEQLLEKDYGIDFDDHSNCYRSFRCHCQSEYCRFKNCL